MFMSRSYLYDVLCFIATRIAIHLILQDDHEPQSGFKVDPVFVITYVLLTCDNNFLF